MTAPLDILAFDLDNTLLDPGSTRYQTLHREFLSEPGHGLPVETLLGDFERLRGCGDALERLGLANSFHDRGAPQSLAALALTAPWPLWGEGCAIIDAAERHRFRLALDHLQALHNAAQRGTPVERLQREMLLRRTIVTSDELRRFQTAVTTVAEGTEWRERSGRYAELAVSQGHIDHRPFLESMAARGITVVVISHGLMRVQSAKLRSLGLMDFFEGRLLVTEAASRIPGWDELERELDERIAGCSDSTAIDEELSRLWRFRCILDRWACKSPEFYGRCLHAIAGDPGCPERALGDLVYTRTEDWLPRDVRFAMVGDRDDADVQPVLASLGADSSWTVHLRSGKHAQIGSAEAPNLGRAHRIFPDWNAVERHLRDDLPWDQVQPIRSAPRMFHAADLDAGLLGYGLRSSLSAVQAICDLAVHANLSFEHPAIC